MLIIVMHNNQQYLDRLKQIAMEESINDFALIKEKDIGLRLIGASASYVFSKGKICDAYERAFVAVIKGKEGMEHFFSVIEKDTRLEMLNLETRGFICAVPFHHITSLEIENSSKNEADSRDKDI